MTDTLHNELKEWFAEQARNKVDSKGKSYWSGVESGNGESISATQEGLHYHPDVVLVERTRFRTQKYFVTIASLNSIQEVVGELFLALLSDECMHIALILLNAEARFFEDLLAKVIRTMDSRFGLYMCSFHILTEEECKDVELAKLKLQNEFDEWI